MSDLTIGLNYTVIVFIVILLFFAVANLVYGRRLETNRARRQFRVRTFYISCLVLVLALARIWVEGFTHILAVLGLISAALVIANKETIMNLVGWLIINWRDLFVEGDLILVQHFRGYVKTIGLFYVTIYEASEGKHSNTTGRVIRVPNGLLATNSLINMSQSSHLLEQSLKFIITAESNVEKAKKIAEESANQVLENYYCEKREYNLDYLKRKHGHFLTDHVSLNAYAVTDFHIDSPTGLIVSCYYYCFSNDSCDIKQQIWSRIIKQLASERDIEFYQ